MSDSNRLARRRGKRAHFPLVVIVLAVSAQSTAWFWPESDSYLMMMAGVLIWGPAILLLLAWWTFFSGVSRVARFAGPACGAAAIAGFFALFRMEGQTGNFVPQFALRSSPTSEERAAEYFKSQSAQSDGPLSDPLSATELPEITSEDWPRFGGAAEDHIVRDAGIRRDWDARPPEEIWRHPVGPGWSSFAIVNNYAFTQEQRGEDEAVVCYDAVTGDQIWLHTDAARFDDAASGPGPRATPTIHDGRLYALGATGILNCLDPLTGDAHWTTNIIDDAETNLIEWGMAGSPLVHDDVVIVNPGGDTGAVAAYDRMTGETRWAGGAHTAGYASPQVATFDGFSQVVIYCAEGLCGFDLSSGRELWDFPWTNMTKINIVQPIVLPDESVFISSGYASGSALLDISRDGDQWNVEPRWTAPNKFKLKFNGGIYRDGYIYGLDEGILSCFDVAKGQRMWKRGRYGYGQIVMTGDDLLVSAESGEVVLVEVSPEKAVEVARFQAIDGKTWNHPVVNRGRLYIRNGQEAACYDLRL